MALPSRSSQSSEGAGEAGRGAPRVTCETESRVLEGGEGCEACAWEDEGCLKTIQFARQIHQLSAQEVASHRHVGNGSRDAK